jgi:hypothetical protein
VGITRQLGDFELVWGCICGIISVLWIVKVVERMETRKCGKRKKTIDKPHTRKKKKKFQNQFFCHFSATPNFLLQLPTLFSDILSYPFPSDFVSQLIHLWPLGAILVQDCERIHFCDPKRDLKRDLNR